MRANKLPAKPVCRQAKFTMSEMVGVGRLELPTSGPPARRTNQLCYTPKN